MPASSGDRIRNRRSPGGLGPDADRHHPDFRAQRRWRRAAHIVDRMVSGADGSRRARCVRRRHASRTTWRRACRCKPSTSSTIAASLPDAWRAAAFAVGDDVLVMPAGKPARIKSIEAWPVPSSSRRRARRSPDNPSASRSIATFSSSAATSSPRRAARPRPQRGCARGCSGFTSGRSPSAAISPPASGPPRRPPWSPPSRTRVDPGLLASDGAEVIGQNHVGEIELDLSRPHRHRSLHHRSQYRADRARVRRTDRGRRPHSHGAAAAARHDIRPAPGKLASAAHALAHGRQLRRTAEPKPRHWRRCSRGCLPPSALPACAGRSPARSSSPPASAWKTRSSCICCRSGATTSTW